MSKNKNLSQIDLFSKSGIPLFEGDVRKMHTDLQDTVQYNLKWKDQDLLMNSLLDQEIFIKFDGLIHCVSCDKEIKKPFAQGFCYDCFVSQPEASECIINPELCRAHLGEGRDVEWEQRNHAQPHFVYLAVSSAVKVGITRSTQVPTRWIDQGASYAIKLAETPYRQLCGVIEVALKSVFTDKTNWRKMLTNDVLEDVDLLEEKWQLEDVLPADLLEYMSEDDEITHINYPVLRWPEKVNSMNLLKKPLINGTLAGIKGQYLIFDDNRVINLRNHSGFNVQIGLCD